MGSSKNVKSVRALHFTALHGTRDAQRLNVVITVCVLQKARGKIKDMTPIPLFGPVSSLIHWTTGSVVLGVNWWDPCKYIQKLHTSHF